MADNADTADPELTPAATGSDEHPPVGETSGSKTPRFTARLARTAGLLTLVATTGLAGWLGWQLHQSRSNDQHRLTYLQTARQGALNVTTIDYHEVDADIRRVLDCSTGAFHDDFQQRAQPFIDVVKQVRSKSVGTITAAGLESVGDHQAQALVTVSVKTSIAETDQPEPRAWRMRISLQDIGNEVKVSNVAFVP